MHRPFVLMNAAVSLDGKLAPPSRRKVRLGSDRDRARMDRLRASSDAVLIGAGTLRSEDPPLQIRSAALRRKRERAGRSPDLLEIVLSRTLDLPLQSRFFGPLGVPRLIVAPRSAPRERIARVASLREVVRVGGASVDVRRLLDRLAERKVRRLLVEGGGEVFAQFLEADLIDEIHVTVSPFLVGGREAPTLFDGTGLGGPPFPRWQLDRCRREGDEVYLCYKRP